MCHNKNKELSLRCSYKSAANFGDSIMCYFIFQPLTQTPSTVTLHSYPKPSWSSEVRDTIKAPVVLRTNFISFTALSHHKLWYSINVFQTKLLSPKTKPKKHIIGFMLPNHHDFGRLTSGTNSSLKIPAIRDTPVVLWDSQRFGPDAAQDNATRSGLLGPCWALQGLTF